MKLIMILSFSLFLPQCLTACASGGCAGVFVSNRLPIAITTTVLPLTGGVDYYVSDCDTGADIDCVPGDDSNDGLSPATAWRTYDRAQDQFGQLNPGDSIRFAKGGSHVTAGSNLWINYNSIVTSPVTVYDYQPTWGSGDEGQPIILQNQANHVFNFSVPGDATVQKGYTFKNLDIQCTVAAKAFFIYDDVDDVLIDNVNIEGCSTGVHTAHSGICSGSAPDCNGVNDRLTIRNSTIANNSNMGFLGVADDLVIENNTFSNNGAGTVFNHNIYIAGGNNGRVSGNTLYKNALDDNGICRGTSFVVHGVVDGLLIEDNIVHEDIGKAGYGCWGIAVGPGYSTVESYTNMTIRGNQIHDVGNVAIGVAACDSCVIENNTVTHNQAYSTVAIKAPESQRAADDIMMTAVQIRNNTIHIGSASSGGVGIRLGGEGINHQVTNNIIQYDGIDSFRCFDFNLPLGSYDDINYNICSYDMTSSGLWEENRVSDLVSWKQTGFGANSQYLNTGL